MRLTIGPIRDHPRTRAFLLEVMREVVAVGRAHGVHLEEDFAENRLAFCDGLPAAMTSSMHNDLEEGKRLEVEWLSGSVVELGEAAGIQTPLNPRRQRPSGTPRSGQTNSLLKYVRHGMRCVAPLATIARDPLWADGSQSQ